MVILTSNNMQKLYIFGVVILFLFMFSVPAQAYNNGWFYKKPIAINNSQNPNSFFDYQLLLNISYKTGMKSDFSDLRFSWFNVSSSVEVPVSYFVENYANNSFAEVWIKIPKIRANSYETVNMRYGNPSAISESNPNSTFDLYDNFEGTGLDANKWNVTGNVSVADGEVKLFDYTAWILSKEFDKNIIAEARSRSGGGVGIYLSVRNDSATEYISIRGSNGADPFWFDTYNGLTWHGGNVASYDTIYHLWKLERNGTNIAKVYQDGNLLNTLTQDLPSGNLKAYFRGGEYVGVGYYTYVDWVRIRKYANPEPIYLIENESSNIGFKITAYTLPSVHAGKISKLDVKVTDSSNTPITNFSSSDFKLFRDSGQINFTDFRNFNNGTYSLNMSSGNTIGNISFSVETSGARAEAFSSVTIKPKSNIVFIANDWNNIFSSGLTGKPVLTNHSETEKYYFGKIRPEQVFVFENLTTDYPTYRFKDKQAFLETFYSNETAVLVSSREQAIAAAPYARLKNIPIVFDNDEGVIKKFNGIINLSEKSADEISDMAIKEFSKAGKNINTITITNPQTEMSALAGAVAAKHNSIIIPMNFSAISYPVTVSDFYNLNSANGVLITRAKINQTIKKLSDNFLFSNSIDYKIGRTQLNLILLGSASEVPQPAVFDSGREIIFDYDGNYLLTDFPYSDANSDGKADLIAGRIVSSYQLIELPKSNKIVTAAIYRNFETVFMGNGLIGSQAADTAFRAAGFETARLVENRTNLSYYELTFGFNNITDFMKNLFKEQSIMESLKLIDTIYSGYNEFLEHNFYKMMNSMSLGWNGLTIKMIPDERLTKESLFSQMRDADGIFYYGLGNGLWQTETFGGGGINFSEFPETSSLVYDERTNSARLPEKIIFEKGISALVGSGGIIYDTYSFMPNARFAQNMAKNKTVALSLENSRYPLLPNQIRNLSASMQFNYRPERDLSIKQFLEMVCYCDPEKKIDPDAQEQGSNPEINHSATFKSRIRIPTNYLVSGNSIFFDAKDYLQEMGKPVVPLYSAETILPNGSRIIGISFNYNLSRHENISADFVPVYRQFNQTIEPVHGFYPSQMFYSEIFDLLDGRKSVKLIAAGMQYNNDTKEALVLDNAEAVIEYSSPFEFVGFSAANITTGMNQTFKIRSFGAQNLSVVIGIKSGNFSETIEYKIPSGVSEIIWNPPFAGNFIATAYVLMKNNSAGPRYAYFSVNSPSFVFFNSMESFGTGGYEKIMRSFAEKIRFAFNGASAIIEYINPFSRFSSSANSSAVEKKISAPDYSFSVSQDSGKIIYHMKDSRGELILEKNAGATKEVCKGDCSGLYAKMDSKLSEMQELQDYVIGNIGK